MALSSLSFSDTVKIVAQYNSFFPDNNRTVNNSDLKKRGYSDEQIAALNQGKKKNYEVFESCGLRFTKPFDHLEYDYFYYILNMFEQFQNGVMPFEGSYTEQPNQIIEIFSLLRALQIEKLKQREEKK